MIACGTCHGTVIYDEGWCHDCAHLYDLGAAALTRAEARIAAIRAERLAAKARLRAADVG